MDNPRYVPVGNLEAVFYAADPEVLVTGAAGTGKSRCCLEKIVSLALHFPNTRFLIVRKTKESINNSIAVTLKDYVIKHLLASGHVIHKGASSKQPAQYEFYNGSVILTAGMDDAEKIKSTEYDMIYVNEATELDENDWMMLLTRIRNNRMPVQQILADCNPSYPHHWLKKRADAGKIRMINTTHKDNPRFWQNGAWTADGQRYRASLASMSGVQRERMYLGKWAATDGLVYEEYDPDVHLTDSPIPDGWPRYWAIDFGYMDAFVCQIWAINPDGVMFLESEIFMTGKTVTEHCKTLKPYAEHNRPRAVVCDSSAPDHIEEIKRELHVNTVKAKKDIALGISLVKQRLKDRKIFFSKNSLITTDPKLVKKSDPTRTVDEFLSYSWSKNKPDVPQDQYNHGMDAMRYMVMWVATRARPNIRILTY